MKPHGYETMSYRIAAAAVCVTLATASAAPPQTLQTMRGAANSPATGLLLQQGSEFNRARRAFVEACRKNLKRRPAPGDIDGLKRAQVAIDGLRVARAAEGVPLLVAWIDFEVEPGFDRPMTEIRFAPEPLGVGRTREEELYDPKRLPALGALIEIGVPAAEGCRRALLSGRGSEDDRRKLLRVIGEVFGPPAGRQWLAAGGEELEDPVHHSTERVLAQYDVVFPPAPRDLDPVPDPGISGPAGPADE